MRAAPRITSRLAILAVGAALAVGAYALTRGDSSPDAVAARTFLVTASDR